MAPIRKKKNLERLHQQQQLQEEQRAASIATQTVNKLLLEQAVTGLLQQRVMQQGLLNQLQMNMLFPPAYPLAAALMAPAPHQQQEWQNTERAGPSATPSPPPPPPMSPWLTEKKEGSCCAELGKQLERSERKQEELQQQLHDAKKEIRRLEEVLRMNNLKHKRIKKEVEE